MTKTFMLACAMTMTMANPIVGGTSKAATPTTPSVIYDFYNSMEEITRVQSASRAFDLQQKM